MSPLLTLTKLSLGYRDNVLVKNLNLEVFPGDFLAVVGANGSGKSTLVRTILGLTPPLSGDITFSGHPRLGYLPQETHPDPHFPTTVSEIVLSGTLGRLGFKPFYGPAEQKSARSALKTLKLTSLANHSFADLSGGQKQRVLLARALAATPELLFLDEPSNNLDPVARHDFYNTLQTLNRDHHLTIIMITHDLDADDLIGNKVLAIQSGSAHLYQTKDYLRHFHPTHDILDHEESK